MGTFLISKNTFLQFLTIYYAPSSVPQGYTDSFYYFDFIFRQQFFDKKLNFTIRTHNTFDTGELHYVQKGNDYKSENWYRYEGPTFIFSLNYKFNNYKKYTNTNQLERDFDSGLDY